MTNRKGRNFVFSIKVCRHTFGGEKKIAKGIERYLTLYSAICIGVIGPKEADFGVTGPTEITPKEI